jgi:hypothetical protein
MQTDVIPRRGGWATAHDLEAGVARSPAERDRMPDTVLAGTGSSARCCAVAGGWRRPPGRRSHSRRPFERCCGAGDMLARPCTASPPFRAGEIAAVADAVVVRPDPESVST